MAGNIKKYKMGVNMKWLYGMIVCAILISACEDNRMADMTDDKIYLLESGAKKVNVVNWENVPYEVIAIKSGIGKQSGVIRLTTDERLLDAYNEDNGTDYRMIPEELYKIVDPEKTIGGEDYRIPFQVEMDYAKIDELQTDSDGQYVFAFRLSKVSGDVQAGDDDEMEAILLPEIVEPYVSFARPGLLSGNTVVDFASPDEIVLFSVVEVNFVNRWNIGFELVSDGKLVEEYNTRNGTNYEMLDPEAYSIDQNSLTIKDFEKEHAYRITIDKNSFEEGNGHYKFGDYLIPVQLTSAERGNIHPESNYQLIPVSFRANQLDRTSWDVTDYNSCICDEPQYDGLGRVPENILDGDADSFWGSKWDEPLPMPYYISIDMKVEQTIYQIDLVKPEADSWRGNLKAGHFEASTDGETWDYLADWEMQSNSERKHTYMVPPVTARYVKFVVSEAFTYSDKGEEPGKGAQVDLAEFVVWGK